MQLVKVRAADAEQLLSAKRRYIMYTMAVIAAIILPIGSALAEYNASYKVSCKF